MKLIIAAQAKSELVRFAHRSTNEMKASSGSPKSCDLSRTGILFCDTHLLLQRYP